MIDTFQVDYLKKYLDNFDKIKKIVNEKIRLNETKLSTKFNKNDIDNSDIVVKQYDIKDIHPDIDQFLITHSKLFKKFNNKYYYFNIFDFKKIINCLIIYKKKQFQSNNLNNLSVIINKNNFFKNKIKYDLKNKFINLDFNDFIHKK